MPVLDGISSHDAGASRSELQSVVHVQNIGRVRKLRIIANFGLIFRYGIS